MKKALSWLLVLALVLAIAPAAFAAGSGEGTLDSPYVYDSVDALVADWNGRELGGGETVYVQAPLGGETLTVTSDTGAACLATTMGAYLAYDSEPYSFTEYWSQGDVITIGICNQNPFGAAVVTLTAGSAAGEVGGIPSEGTVTYDGWPTWDPSEGYAITPEVDGTVTVEVTAADPGFDVCLQNVDADEWGDDHYMAEPGTVELTVSAGVNYIVYVYPAVVDGMISYTSTGSVTYKITFTPAESGGEEGGEPADGVVISGSDTILASNWSGATYSYTASADGTLTVVIDEAEPGWTYIWEIGFENDTVWGDYGVATTHEHAIKAGETFVIHMYAYDPETECYADGTVTFHVVFTAGESSGDGEEAGEPTVGTEENPIIFTQDLYYAATVPANSTVWYVFDDSVDCFWNGIYEQAYSFVGPTGYTVVIGGQSIEADANGYVNGSCWGMNGYYVFNITNNTDTEATYYVSFSNKETYAVDYETKLHLGENELELFTDVETTIYEFEAEEAGIYTFTVDDENALVGYWGGGTFYVSDQTENKTNTLIFTVTEAGQSVMVGISGVETCTLVISREEYIPSVEVEWTYYENTHKFPEDPYEIPEGSEVVAIDVTDDVADVAVLGKDGFYHWGTANGPIVVADLYSSDLLNFAEAVGLEAFRVVYLDEDGNITSKVNYSPAVGEYGEMGLYPVTEELAWMLKEIGSAVGFGWYDSDVLGSYLFGDAEVDPDTAWLGFCSYVTGTETTGNEIEPDDEGPAATGDVAIAAAVITLMTSATGLVITKKKFF